MLILRFFKIMKLSHYHLTIYSGLFVQLLSELKRLFTFLLIISTNYYNYYEHIGYANIYYFLFQ